MAASGSDCTEDEGWETCIDDGFVYQRKKRPAVLDPSTSIPPPPDPAAEENNRRARRIRALVKLREKYQKEIDQWKLLSNTLQLIQQKAQEHQVVEEEEDQQPTTTLVHSSVRDASGPLIDELLLQAELQEDVIRDVSNLCDIADALCNAQEERLKQAFLDLPIWSASPWELVQSLGQFEDK